MENEIRLVLLELQWIQKRARLLVHRGFGLEAAVGQAVEEQMAMAEYDLTWAQKAKIRKPPRAA